MNVTWHIVSLNFIFILFVIICVTHVLNGDVYFFYILYIALTPIWLIKVGFHEVFSIGESHFEPSLYRVLLNFKCSTFKDPFNDWFNKWCIKALFSRSHVFQHINEFISNYSLVSRIEKWVGMEAIPFAIASFKCGLSFPLGVNHS